MNNDFEDEKIVFWTLEKKNAIDRLQTMNERNKKSKRANP